MEARVINVQPIALVLDKPGKQSLRLVWVERLFNRHRTKIKYIQLGMLLLFLVLVIVSTSPK